jgi:hypothetical protein
MDQASIPVFGDFTACGITPLFEFSSQIINQRADWTFVDGRGPPALWDAAGLANSEFSM